MGGIRFISILIFPLGLAERTSFHLVQSLHIFLTDTCLSIFLPLPLGGVSAAAGCLKSELITVTCLYGKKTSTFNLFQLSQVCVTNLWFLFQLNKYWIYSFTYNELIIMFYFTGIIAFVLTTHFLMTLLESRSPEQNKGNLLSHP